MAPKKKEVLYILDLIGTFAFAISGTLAAANKRLDIFGALMMAAVTGVGGGTLRDLILGAHPVAWASDYNYLIVISAATAFTFAFRKTVSKLRKTLFLFDTVGIGVFTVMGLEKALNYGILPGVAVVMGTFTAVMGGAIRDTLCNEIPLIFRKEIYATACFVGGILYLILNHFEINNVLNTCLTVFTIICIRLFSIKYHLQLPVLPEEA
ncbi:trimeric intracellular cation channel family protein [Limibacter armeniacum]|uniref:trimeric intracellular cation channel family protein n=1 Tax=Limibacter armeniacum TaxID=466084 RepID=UPI002FE61ACC